MPLLNRTLAVFLSPEFGFLGLVIPTRKHTPFIAGLLTSCGETFLRAFCPTRQPRRTWLKVASCDWVVVKVRLEPLRAVSKVEGVECGRNDGAGNRRRRRRNVSGISLMDVDGAKKVATVNLDPGVDVPPRHESAV
jgi:hypothetical protein